MSKKKMYRLLAFILFTFGLLAVVITIEFSRYSNRTEEQSNNGLQSTNETVNTADKENLNETADSVDTSTEDENSDSAVSPVPVENTVENEREDTKKTWKDINLLFSGDIYLSDYVLNQYKQNGIDGILSKDLLDEFQVADIAMVNQEFAFTNRGIKAENKQYTFRVDPQNVQVFKDMQIDIVTLANNHTMDFGIEGLTDSFETLKSAGIKYAGAGNDLSEARNINYFDVNGKKIAYLAASRVIPEPGWNAYKTKAGMLTTYDPAFLLEDIKTAKSQSDFVVVYVHWGLEKHELPEEYQRNLAKQYIDAGADLVLGSHPHVLQGIEYYNGKPIIYSLGNFIFYNSINQTALLKVSLNEKNEAKIQLLPGKAENSRTIGFGNDSDKAEFYNYLTNISFGIHFDKEGNIIPQ